MKERLIEVREINTGDILIWSKLPLCASKFECKQEANRLHGKLPNQEKDTYIVERFSVNGKAFPEVERKYSSQDLIGLFN